MVVLMIDTFIVQRGSLPAKCFKHRQGLKVSFLAIFTHQKRLQTNEYVCEQLLIS